MYLPSKIKLRILAIYVLAIFLLFLPFKNTIQNLFAFFSHQLTITSQGFSRENEKLKKENISLQLKVKGAAQLKKENETLRKAFSFKEKTGFNLVGAGVLSFSPSSWRRYLLINAGAEAGMKKGLLAVDERGKLVGKITEVKKVFSHLLLLNDPNFSLSVFIEEKTCGLLKGNLTGAKILYIEEGAGIQKGDRVWVKVDSSSFPIEVGKIQSVKKGANQLFCDIEVKIAPENAFFDKVFIIK